MLPGSAEFLQIINHESTRLNTNNAVAHGEKLLAKFALIEVNLSRRSLGAGGFVAATITNDGFTGQ
jgi:hypothetical protein